MSELIGTVIFFDLVEFSTNPNPSQLKITRSFFRELKKLLDELWVGFREHSQNPYVILPTGDGAAIVLKESAPRFKQQEYTAIWLAGSLLIWAKAKKIGIRCGINKGILYPIKDPNDQDNICGLSITIAQRIMDAAKPGQLLVHQEFDSWIKKTKKIKNFLEYNLSKEEFEILVKHQKIIKVKNITGNIIRNGTKNPFGIHEAPADKWHLQIEPPILDLDSFGIRQKKTPPEKLLEKHDRIAFVGASNDQLGAIFSKVINKKPSKIWESITIYFLSDKILKWMETKSRPFPTLVKDKQRTISALKNLFQTFPLRIRHFEMREYDRPFFFASYWDWDKPGGRIHISPYIWGADVRICPGLDYTWITQEPTPQYQAYREGINHLKSCSRLIR
jgi:hypothetical protein